MTARALPAPPDQDLLAGLTWQVHRTHAGATTWGDSSDSWPASVPGTLAGALRAAGELPAGTVGAAALPEGADDADWWWVSTLELPDDRTWRLRLRGVATVSQVLLDGAEVARSVSGLDDVVADLRGAGRHELAIVCRALSSEPVPRRPRARWRANLIADPSLRWRRTPLIGRIPWAGTAPVIGPWGQADLTPVPEHGLEVLAVRTELPDPAVGAAEPAQAASSSEPGRVLVTVRAARETALVLRCAGAEQRTAVPAGRHELTLEVPAPRLWWPRTHGEPVLHELEVDLTDGAPVLRRQVGFRHVRADRSDGGFALIVNGVRIFARGAVWHPLDPITLNAPAERIERTVELLAQAGANLLRVSGTGAWEPPAFYAACDRAGVLVWQDALLATLDPPEDPDWQALLAAELATWLPRLGAHPSLAVVSGGNETLQQPALWGRDLSALTITALERTVPEAVARWAPQAAHVTSSPCGGTPPTRPDQGISHWFGVGAYRRPLEDVHAAGVRFAAEALAFGCPPAEQTLREAFGSPTADQDDAARTAWAHAAARDPGADWDFEDVSAHYARRWLDPGAEAERGALGSLLERPQPPRWDRLERAEQLEAERIASGQAVQETVAALRAGASGCDGVLVLSAADLLPGAGWGLIDALGRPKATLDALHRAAAPLAVVIASQGLAGLHVRVHHDRPGPVRGVLHLAVTTTAGAAGPSAAVPVELEGPGEASVAVEPALGGFLDLDLDWGFGQRQWELLRAELELTDCEHGAPPDAVLVAQRPLGGPHRDRGEDLAAAVRGTGRTTDEERA